MTVLHTPIIVLTTLELLEDSTTHEKSFSNPNDMAKTHVNKMVSYL